MWDLIVSVPDHCLSFYFSSYLDVVFVCFKSESTATNIVCITSVSYWSSKLK